MHKECPLPEQMWLDWITDVEAAAATHGNDNDSGTDAAIVPALTPILAKAVSDYLSIPLWIKYIEIAAIRDAGLSLSPSHCCPDFYRKQRTLCERAVAVAGLHWTEGWKVWDAYRIFETSILETLDEAIDDTTNAIKTEQVTQWKEEQEGIVRQLYHRQLSLPHDNLAATLQSYCEWEMERNDQWSLPHEVKSLYEKTLKHTELRRPYEDSITQATGPDERLLAAYLSYIKVEESNLINTAATTTTTTTSSSSSDEAGISRVCMLYERAVAVFPVTHHLWLSYARFLEYTTTTTSTNKIAIVKIYRRAVRNCPWVGQLWSRLVRAEERGGGGRGDGSNRLPLSSSRVPIEEEEEEEYYKKLFEKALTSSIQGISIYREGSEGCIDVVIACLEFIRRRGGAGGRGGGGGMWGGLPVEGAMRKYACEAAQLLSQYCPEECDCNGRIASMLTAVENMEENSKGNGGKNKSGGPSPQALEAREKLLKTAVAKQGASWLAFINQDKRKAAAAAAAGGGGGTSSLAAVRALFERAVNRLRLGGGYGLKQVCRAWLQFEQEYGGVEDNFAACLKVDMILVEIAGAEAAAQASAQMTASAHAAVAAAAAHAPPARPARPAGGDRDNARGGRSGGRGGAGGGRGGGRDRDSKGRGKKRQTTTGSDGNNGDKCGDAPPPAKRSKPDSDDVHGSKDKGKEKKMPPPPNEQQQQQKDNKERPKQKEDASTAPPPPKQQQQQQQSKSAPPDTTSAPPTTAFVKHLWEEATHDNLKEIFEPYGSIALIKLNRNPITGKHKGYAYVKYETEDAMKAACEGLDGKEVHGKHIFVAPSNPPSIARAAYGGSGGGRGGRGGGLGGRGAGPSDRAHVKLEVGGVKPTSFLPRSVATRPTDKNNNGGGAPKSNEEFRNMLFAQK
jgi:squamous cell carcinoma antigen recognized by T-cells 3